MTIGDKIYQLRGSLALTQKEFADIVGVSQSAINFWENNKRQPRIEQLQKIANASNVPLGYFIDFNTLSQMLGDEKEENELLDNYRKLNHFGKMEAQKRIQELTEIKRYTDPTT